MFCNAAIKVVSNSKMMCRFVVRKTEALHEYETPVQQRKNIHQTTLKLSEEEFSFGKITYYSAGPW